MRKFYNIFFAFFGGYVCGSGSRKPKFCGSYWSGS